MKTGLLRIALPRLGEIRPDALAAFGWRAGAGAWQDGGLAPLREIAARFGAMRAEASLHPEDVALTDVPLPPLPEKRRRAAILAEVEALALGEVEELAMGFGARNDDGAAPVAWTEQDRLDGALARLRAMGLNVRAVYAAPFFLPLPDAGACGVLVDGWAVLRTGRDAGLMHAVHAAAFPEAGAGEPPDDAPPPALPVLSEPIQWLDAGPARSAGPGASSTPSGAPSRWAGPCAAWSIPVGGRQRGGGRQNWTRAAGACAVAAAVWVAGLNLYAYRLAHHGQAIQAHMRDRVKAVFPDLPVVVNPLQQARQQRDAWPAVGDDPDSARFSRTIRASAAVIDNLAGQVQSMRYAGGELVLTLRGGKPASADEAAALAQRASEAGLAATADASGWTLRLDPQAMPPALAARNTPGAAAKGAG